ncbi:hypothetical protein [Paenimyroides baculatum]|uniref:Uncharacterized protein n=1 Tax=Paenimyroides baculatum TaxID=2608000 RepID=A0A5M6CH97_9FLAO|nr:hypothetical protein [Paenimyroides baculatum]KAA5532785.1 hypothetical protein F0460_13145 [Paenimyroides baculatum]
MSKKDEYSIENDFNNFSELFDKCLHKQVVYRDGRVFQRLIFEWKNYRLPDSREFIKIVQKDKGIMDMLSKVQPFSSYGLVSNKLAITFKKDLILSKKRSLAIIKYITKITLKLPY